MMMGNRKGFSTVFFAMIFSIDLLQPGVCFRESNKQSSNF
jgi:hypothetical protein